MIGYAGLDFCPSICNSARNVDRRVHLSGKIPVQITQTPIPGVQSITPARHGDHRGFFSESWNKRALQQQGLDVEFVQDNHSFSHDVGTVRGLHFQAPPHAQAKLVRCGRGRFFDVVVDIRKGSPTYGKWYGEELSFANGKQLYVPQGFLHGFMTLEMDTEILYKCSDYYAPECDGSVRWDSCGIAWPLDVAAPILSAKDKTATSFDAFESPFAFESAT